MKSFAAMTQTNLINLIAAIYADDDDQLCDCGITTIDEMLLDRFLDWAQAERPGHPEDANLRFNASVDAALRAMIQRYATGPYTFADVVHFVQWADEWFHSEG